MSSSTDKSERSDSSSSSSQRSGGSSTSEVTSPSEDEKTVKLPDPYEEDISAEYGDRLPALPGKWTEGLEPLASNSSLK